jgi:hypothetical protein
MNKRHALLVLAAAGLVWLGCPQVRSQPYSAQEYDPDADCLYPGTVIDVVPGAPDDAGGCDAICITDLDGDVYYATQCPPLPIEFNLSGDDPACKQAFAARCRQCPGNEAGLETVCDAGAPEDAAPEAAADAKEEAREDAKPEAAADAHGDDARD